jgi:hypothetical protein
VADELGLNLEGAEPVAPILPSPPVAPTQPLERVTLPAPLVPPQPPVAPAPEPTLPETLGDPWKISMLIIVLGLIALFAALLDAFWKLIRWGFGPLLPRSRRNPPPAETWLQWLSNSLGTAFQGIDPDVGQSFHKSANLLNHLGDELLRGAQVSHQTAAQVKGVRGRQATQTATEHATAQQTRRVAHEQTALQHAQTARDARSRQAEQTTQGQIDGLTHHVTHVLEPELEALRDRIPNLEHGATVAWDEIKKHEELLGLGALTAATATALGRLGAGWTRCENNKSLGDAMCGADSNLARRLNSK